MPTAMFISPHLDDVAFSCGATVVRLASAGWRTVLVTVFTASVPSPKAFALECQLDKGIGPDVDYLAVRRREDRRFATRAGVTRCVWLDLPEAPHRGYESAAALFGAYVPSDDVAGTVAQRLQGCVDDERPDVVFAPQALGAHVDHRRVVEAVAACCAPAAVLWYADLPYAIKRPGARSPVPLVNTFPEVALDVSTALRRKGDVVGCYASQLGFQFGGATAASTALTAHARAEGIRLGAMRPAEVVRTARADWDTSTDTGDPPS